DDGMLDYRRIHENRVLEGRVGGEPTSRDAAITKAAELLTGADPDSVAVLLSAEHSQEDNAALLWLGREVLGASAVYATGRPEGEGDDVLRHVDKNPNQVGLFELVAPGAPGSFADFVKAVQSGRVRTVVALGSQIPDPAAEPALASILTLIALSTHAGPLSARATGGLPASGSAAGG